MATTHEQSKPMILSLDVGGHPVTWLPWQHAVRLYTRDDILWTLGEPTVVIYGGVNRATGERSRLAMHTIVAVRGADARYRRTVVPALTNRALFQRDRHTCLYCGGTFSAGLLTRDHVVPRSLGGGDHWRNVVTACRACNTHKGNQTPEQARMPLLAVPYAPSHAEYLILANRRILADQMEFLRLHVPRTRRHLLE
jgi:5-methylcytosine-specific restriction endonuclease McrA